jgi:hypothetical protein
VPTARPHRTGQGRIVAASSFLPFAAFVLVLGLVTMMPASVRAQAPSDTSGELSRLEPWCGGPKKLAPCVDQIIIVDSELKRREADAKRTGRGYNFGLSLRGCQVYCILRHFPQRRRATAPRQFSGARPSGVRRC